MITTDSLPMKNNIFEILGNYFIF